MTRLAAALRDLAEALAGVEAQWALVGGLAVSARSEPRLTRDVDVVVAVGSDEDAEALIHRLLGVGYRPGAILEQTRTGRLATARLRPPNEPEGGMVVDLLFASSGVEPEVAAGADVLEVLDGIRVPVAQPGHLFAMKVLSRDDDGRPQDRIDLAALGKVVTKVDIQLARRTVALITKRGFHRDRKLADELERTVAVFAPGAIER